MANLANALKHRGSSWKAYMLHSHCQCIVAAHLHGTEQRGLQQADMAHAALAWDYSCRAAELALLILLVLVLLLLLLLHIIGWQACQTGPREQPHAQPRHCADEPAAGAY